MIWLHRILALCVGIVIALAAFALMMAAGMALAFHYFGDLGWFGIGPLLPIAACGSLIPGFFAALFAYARLQPSSKTTPSR